MACSVALLLAASVVSAEPGFGTVGGQAGTIAGDPVPGAVVSLFAKGRGSYVAVSDDDGRFSIQLPAGRYTLRALAPGLLSPLARRVLVIAQSDLLLDVRFTAAKAAATVSTIRVVDEAALRELAWLVRHKRRSVLEGQEEEAGVSAPRTIASQTPVEGSCWLVAGPSKGEAAQDDHAASASVVEVGGDLSNARWSAAGVLPDGTMPAWRATAELRLENGGRHEWRAVSAYAGRDGLGAVLGETRWQIARGVALSGGMLYTYRPGQAAAHHIDPIATLELSDDFGSRVRVRSIGRTVVAGGDPLGGTYAAAPAGALSSSGSIWPARRHRRHDLQLDRQWGPAVLSVHAFAEESHPRPQPSSSVVAMERGLVAQGVGARVDTRIGRCVIGSLTYTRGCARPSRRTSSFEDRAFDEWVWRVEARVPQTRTRVAAYYRLHQLRREDPIGRFDVQVIQPLPFVPGFANSRWEVLVALRNLVYESTEPGSIDELTTSSPARVVAGLSLSF